MTDPNLVTVYGPKGQTAEVTRLNGHDLTTHYGWSYQNLVAAATPAPPAPPVTPAAEPTPAAPATTPVEDETEADDAVADAVTARTTVEAFDDLADKKDVAAYIEQTFPGTKIDGRANRDKLVALAIELAA